MEASTTQEQTEVARLEETREELLEDLEHLRADLRNMAEPSADEADVDAYEREKTWALVQRLQYKLELVERAIQAAYKGHYGICEHCGARIDPARLEILPEATLCLECQRKYERQMRRARI
ncbi:MAG: TraR/DksA family transcriptional regulator [Anaerolineae bacterium]